MPYSQSTTPSKLHTSPTQQLHWLWISKWTKTQNCLHVLQCSHIFCPLTFLKSSTVIYNPSCCPHSLSDACMLNSNFNPWLTRFVTLWSPHLEQSPPRHQELCYSLFLQHQTRDISLRIFKLSNTVLHHHLSVQYVCACMCVCMHVCVSVCVCVCVCILPSHVLNLVDIHVQYVIAVC